MKKQIIQSALRLLKLRPLFLFIHVCLPIGFIFYFTPAEDFLVFNKLFSSLGWIVYFFWIFAIGHRAIEKVVSQNIAWGGFRYFIPGYVVSAILFIVMLFTTTKEKIQIGLLQVEYIAPLVLTISAAVMFLIVIIIASKTLVSAETGSNANLGSFLPTALLLFFFPIGLWFIQPRIQRL